MRGGAPGFELKLSDGKRLRWSFWPGGEVSLTIEADRQSTVVLTPEELHVFIDSLVEVTGQT